MNTQPDQCRTAESAYGRQCLDLAGHDGDHTYERARTVPVLAAVGLPAAEACTDPSHTGPIRAQLGCTGPAPDVTVPRTERSYWQDITDALNALNTAGGSIGIDLDGTLSDHRAWSVVWDRDDERWALIGYADEPEGTKEAPAVETHTDGTEAADAAARRLRAVELLCAGLTSTTEQPTGLTWEARAEHAVRLYATTAIELEDARRENTQLRDRLAELEQGQADADALTAEHPDTVTALVDEIADDIPHRRAPQIAADYLNRHARLLAEQITTLGQARGWSTWAAALIHPDREFVDPGEDDDQAGEQPPAVPKVGDRYEKRANPDAGRIVTISRVWGEGADLAVAYDWRDDKPGQAGSACPIEVFRRAYKAAAEQPLAFPQLAVPCPQCDAPAGQLCTSHSGTRTRTNNTHQARTRAYRAQQAGR
ncbi:hypothetical protein HXS80_20625 [Streptomyces sp. CB04723]|uniref:zinc finger domain-containing protein n=1 Tax=Streptomyces TaxID=1883 RepID=UPI0015C45673|nr:hypothetical protein [Streptomyces sp. CB04723]QLG33809.1 hypothetical protein HXS80_20625 [Streptomyces sp. CB04723]